MKTASELKGLFENHLLSLPFKSAAPASLYEPVEYILELSGKRIRPLLSLMAFQACSTQNPDKALNLATAIELFHNFSLIHDDIMDNAPLRRGMATVHLKWNNNTAILSGDAMFALSFQYLIRDFPERAEELVNTFSRMATAVCEGQMEDMEMSGLTGSVSIDQYIEMIRKKTAVLIGASLSLGAIAAGADATTVSRLYDFGEALGIAFQLQDDLMDVYAEQEKFGKQVGGDILENKKTYPLLRAFELADEAQSKELSHLIHHEKNAEVKVREVVKIYDDLKIKTFTEEKIKEYFNQLKTLEVKLQKLSGFSMIKDYLKSIIQRDF